MRSALRRGLFFSLLLALTFSFSACDSGGSNSGPDWTGTWEVVDFEGVQGAPEDPNYWNLSENELQVFVQFQLENDPNECRQANFELIEQDGDVATFQGSTPNVADELIEFRFETSGETLSATVLSSSDEPDNVGNELTLSSADEVPFDTGDCETTDQML